MSAGQPDWAKLYAMGKLPKESRGQIPLLDQLDKAEAKIAELEEENRKLGSGESSEPKKEKEEVHIAKCQVEGCEFEAKGKSEPVANNNLRLHSKTHLPSKVE